MRAVPAGSIIGCDFAGTIEDSNGSHWRTGQRVAGFVHGTWETPKRGAFAEYLVTENDVVYAIPESVSDEDAATLPLAFGTAVQALIQRLGLPEPSKPAKSPFPVLINGGTSSVGKYAVQLAKAAGLIVIATGSQGNHALLKELGADHCVDYKDTDWPEQVKKISKEKLEYAFDCISEGGTTGKIAEAMSPARGGHIVTLLPTKDDIENDKVKVESTIVYTVFNKKFKYGAFNNQGAPRPEDKAVWVKYLKLLPELLTSKTIKPNRVKLLDGGLDGIMKGFDLQIAGKVSAEKLVYKL